VGGLGGVRLSAARRRQCNACTKYLRPCPHASCAADRISSASRSMRCSCTLKRCSMLHTCATDTRFPLPTRHPLSAAACCCWSDCLREGQRIPACGRLGARNTAARAPPETLAGQRSRQTAGSPLLLFYKVPVHAITRLGPAGRYV